MRKPTAKKTVSETSLKFERIYFSIAAISLALILWQQWGMNKVIDVYPNSDIQIFARGDYINGGRSESTLTQSRDGTKLHCETKPSNTFAFCNLEVTLGTSSQKGEDLRQFDHLLLWLDHKSSVQDTVLVYLINSEINSSNSKSNYSNKSNMKTILPAPGRSFYRLPLRDFSVPSWWILQNKATGPAAETNLNNVISLSIATGDSNKTRSVDILLKKAQFTGKWLAANTLYWFLFLSWIATISVHAGYRVYQLSEQLKLKRIQNIKLEELNNFLSIQKNEFELLAKTDSLTGLSNRAGTREILQKIQSQHNSDCSLIMFDIDFFKQLNDTYGHEEGDNVLRELAKLVTTFVRETDHIARWGGEEFIILCPETNLQNAVALATNLQKHIAATPLTYHRCITCSFGVSQYQLEGKNSIKSMFTSADLAMYRAKKTGRNRVEFQTSNLHCIDIAS